MNLHARLLVDDYKGCFLFYRDILELTATFGDEASNYADFVCGDTAFALFHRSEMEAAVGAPPELLGGIERDRVVLVIGVDDLDTMAGELVARGVQLNVPITAHPEWGIRTAHLRDPDGNLIELNIPLPHHEGEPAREMDVEEIESSTG